MDFHSLTRKELQTLCKRNKIPANITNVAMADALKALEIVEGLDEFMNQSQSPEKTMNKSSQEVPSTVARTSTRRKTTKEEPQSTQPTTRTRRTTRRTMELNEENKNVNVPDTPVMATTSRRRAQKNDPEVEEQKNSDLLETPALQTGRRRPGVGSTRRKVEVQKEGSLRQGYGTRRSVRLLEKCMAGMSLKESERMEPVKIDVMVEDAVEENKNGQSEDTSVVPLARNLSASLEDERDLKDDVLENSECHNEENDSTVISEAGSHKSDNLDCLSALKDTKDAFPNEKTDEPEGEDKLGDIPNGILDPKGSDNIAVSEDSYEIDNLTEELIAENNGGSHADETNSIDILVADTIEDISEKVLDHSSSAEFMEPIEGSAEEYANHAPQEIECQKLVGKDCDTNAVHDALAKLPKAEGDVDGKAAQNVSVLPKRYMDSSEKMENEDDDPNEIVPESNIVDAFLGDSDIDDDTGSDNNSLADELQEEVSCEQKGISIPTAAYSSEDLMTSNMVDEEALVEVNVADELQEEVSCEQKGISIPTAAYSSEDPMTSNMVDEEALVEVNVADAEIIHVSSFHNAFQSVMDDIPVHKMLDYGDAEALVDVCVKSEPMTSNMVDEEALVDVCVKSEPMTSNMVDEEALVDVNIADAEIIHASSFHNAFQSVVDDMEDGEALVDVNVADAEIINVSSFHNAFQSVMDDIPVHKMLDCGDAKALVDVCVKSEPMTGNMVDEEALVDVNVADAEIIHVSSFRNALQSVMDDIPVHKMLDYGDAEALVDVCVKSEPMTSNMVDEEALVDVNVADAEIIQVSSFHNAFQSVVDDMEDGEALVHLNVADAEIINVSSFHNALQSVMDDIPVHKMLDYGDAEALVDVCVKSEPMTRNMVDEEALVDVNVADADIIHVSSFHNALQSVEDDIPVHKMLDYGDAEALVAVRVKPVEEFAEAAQEILPEEKTPTAAKPRTPCPSLFPNSAITTSMPLSPLTAQFSQLTRFTPRKSSSKKETTIPKVTQVSDNNNKENIDKNNSTKEVTEPSLGKMKKNKNIVDEETMQQLESMSLRNLKKLTKKFDKLQITGNMKNRK